ncbi:MAG: DUF58 domain-containing protein [Thermoanaerobaculia bacterium]
MKFPYHSRSVGEPVPARKGLRRFFDTGILVRVTNLGLGFILMTLVVAIGATNTGNNGLYLLVSVFLGALVVSGIVSRRNVEGVEVSLDGPAEVFAGEPSRFTLRLKNLGRLPRRGVLVKIGGAAAPILFSRIEPGEEEERGVDLVFPRRGRRQSESFLVYSGFPIGLFRKGRVREVADERVVYPSLRLGRPPRPDPRESESGDPRSRRAGRGAEIRNLRDAVFGDDPRDVHWPQTARQGKFIIKERAAEEGRDALVRLDIRRPDGAGPGWNEGFEAAVSEAAGLALQLLARGSRVGLLLGGRILAPGTGPAHRRALLSALALVEPSADPAPALVSPPPSMRVFTVDVPWSGRAA